jgi:hypothetical protein
LKLPFLRVKTPFNDNFNCEHAVVFSSSVAEPAAHLDTRREGKNYPALTLSVGFFRENFTD